MIDKIAIVSLFVFTLLLWVVVILRFLPGDPAVPWLKRSLDRRAGIGYVLALVALKYRATIVGTVGRILLVLGVVVARAGLDMHRAGERAEDKLYLDSHDQLDANKKAEYLSRSREISEFYDAKFILEWFKLSLPKLPAPPDPGVGRDRSIFWGQIRKG
jgi:hypothetical protein